MYGTPEPAVRRSEALRDLEALKLAILTLNTISKRQWGLLERCRDTNAKPRLRDAEMDLLFLFTQVERLDENALLIPALEKLCARMRREIRDLPDARNINLKAVQAVDARRDLWLRNTGKTAPSQALNPNCQFAQFLRDGFVYLNIEADPVSAFKRWVATLKK